MKPHFDKEGLGLFEEEIDNNDIRYDLSLEDWMKEIKKDQLLTKTTYTNKGSGMFNRNFSLTEICQLYIPTKEVLDSID